MKQIDLRSDTVTRPTKAMREYMACAVVGDDVYGEDPTVNQLEERLAALSGMEAGLFVSSGTQGNLLALLSHCQRGDEYIAGQTAHTYRYEGGGAAILGSIQPQPLDFSADGSLDLEKVRQVIKPEDSHFARTRLLCLENTQAGKVLSLDYQRQAAEFARNQGLALHLDGARIFNACVQLQVPLEQICRNYDSVSICLSKGLGAPVGSVLCGSAELIASARRWRKVVGGGMRQAGILAAAGIYALNEHVDRLAEDHHNARMLAEGLNTLDGIHIIPEQVQTNMVFVQGEQELLRAVRNHLAEHNVLVGGYDSMRLVTHMDVDRADIEKAITLFAQALDSCRALHA